MKLTIVIAAGILTLAALMLLDRAGSFRPPAEPLVAAKPATIGSSPIAASGKALPKALPADVRHQDTVETMPSGKGQEETFYLCAACHGTALIKAQGMTRDGWESTFQYMVDRHGMADPDRADRDLIVDYLAEHFPPRRRGRGQDNPFLKN
ncbi:MAG: hypothetical protein KF889_12665 [Alphaproteobacteria bacterium]|nr:hypothetical protein [Alphaproteobacteria bacterium]MCW5739154.1 hypothetical protein [Alphaproteobacteria bacterium]